MRNYIKLIILFIVILMCITISRVEATTGLNKSPLKGDYAIVYFIILAIVILIVIAIISKKISKKKKKRLR